MTRAWPAGVSVPATVLLKVREVGIQIPWRDRAHKTAGMADAGSGGVEEVSSRSVAGQVGAEDFPHGSLGRQSQVRRLWRVEASDQAHPRTVVSQFKGCAKFELMGAIL